MRSVLYFLATIGPPSHFLFSRDYFKKAHVVTAHGMKAQGMKAPTDATGAVSSLFSRDYLKILDDFCFFLISCDYFQESIWDDSTWANAQMLQVRCTYMQVQITYIRTCGQSLIFSRLFQEIGSPSHHHFPSEARYIYFLSEARRASAKREQVDFDI